MIPSRTAVTSRNFPDADSGSQPLEFLRGQRPCREQARDAIQIAMEQFFIEYKLTICAGEMPGLLVPARLSAVRIHHARRTNTSPPANPMAHEVPHHINGTETSIVG